MEKKYRRKRDGKCYPVQGRSELERRRILGVSSDAPVVANGTETLGSENQDIISESNKEQVIEYLRSHPEFLERYVLEEIELEQLERWMIRSTQRSKKKPDSSDQHGGKNGRKTSLSRWKFCVHADKRKMLQELTRSLQQNPSQGHVLWELAGCISSAVSAEGHRLYLTSTGDPEQLGLYLGMDTRSEIGEPKVQVLGSGLTVPIYVGSRRESLRLSVSEPDPRFPDWKPPEGDTAHVLYQPVVQPDGQLVAVVELWRTDPAFPFHEEDEEIASSYLVWGGIALHYAHLYISINKQRKLSDFLLNVVRSIFQDMVSMDALVIKVMNFAQRLVDADRASLFLVDNKSKELYARIFDVGVTSSDEETESDIDALATTVREIRFPLGTGIAGQVALTGDGLNITDAYCDPRFNRSIDQLTGYHTRTILCMPIFIRDGIIGVMQMVNKHTGNFTKEDEEAFQVFAVYCGLALHHAKLYNKIVRSEQKYKVALDVLSYHNTCSEDEFHEVISHGVPDTVPTIDSYYFDVFSLDDFDKARNAIYMFKDLFGLTKFDRDYLIRFILTIKKNYRRVPYHNWTHGFSVANSMYSVIKHSPNVFKSNEELALFVGALCHDLDHRGKNNKFMLETESPLAAIYSTSTMEHHHFNQTVTILQQQGHNIFSKLNSSEYKQVLSFLKHCILATDLALFFSNKARLTELLSSTEFSWNNQEHRMLTLALSMTACDLSASAKPWNLQVKTVKVIFQEFYEQGDAERVAGKVPIPMMDRNQPDQQASSQVGFLNGICIPCYSLMNKLIPTTNPLLEQCQSNLERWKKIDEELNKSKDNNEGTEPSSPSLPASDSEAAGGGDTVQTAEGNAEVKEHDEESAEIEKSTSHEGGSTIEEEDNAAGGGEMALKENVVIVTLNDKKWGDTAGGGDLLPRDDDSIEKLNFLSIDKEGLEYIPSSILGEETDSMAD